MNIATIIEKILIYSKNKPFFHLFSIATFTSVFCHFNDDPFSFLFSTSAFLRTNAPIGPFSPLAVDDAHLPVACLVLI